MAGFETGSTVMFVKNNVAIKGTVVGYHNNLGMFKIKDEAGKDYLIELDDLALCEKEVEGVSNIKEDDLVVIKASNINSDYEVVSDLLGFVKDEEIGGTVYCIDYSDNTALVVALFNRTTLNEFGEYFSPQWVNLEDLEKINISLEETTEATDLTKNESETSECIKEGDEVIIQKTNLGNFFEVADKFKSLVENEVLAGTVIEIDKRDGSAFISDLYNIQTKQMIRGCGGQWACTQDLKKVHKEEEEKEINELVALINKWGTDRNITLEGGTTPQKQVSKLLEEVAECIEALDDVALDVDGAEDKLKDAYGDMLVCIIQAIRLSGMDFTDCLNVAYNEIKDRKGTMINGKFVKEA